MQHYLFDSEATGKTVIAHVKHLISRRFPEQADIPDLFISMPESVGGLGLKNPFIPLYLLRDPGSFEPLCEDPDVIMRDFHESERKQYFMYKKNFEALTEKERRKRYKAAFREDEDDGVPPPIAWEQAQEFMSFEDFTATRECTSSSLSQVYRGFLQQPLDGGITVSSRIRRSLKRLDSVPEGLDVGAGTEVAELIWTVQFFEDELFDQFGGLELVDKTLLPLGVLKAMKAKKVTWQMVL